MGDGLAAAATKLQKTIALPVVLLKSDITKKHKIDAIQFRIRKEQNLSLGNSANTGKVLDKLNHQRKRVKVNG